MPMHQANFNSYVPTVSSQSMLPVPKFLTESRSNGTLGLQGVASQLMKADNKRYLNIGTDEDTHSIQNQDIEVTFPDSVENRSAANFRTIPN